MKYQEARENDFDYFYIFSIRSLQMEHIFQMNIMTWIFRWAFIRQSTEYSQSIEIRKNFDLRHFSNSAGKKCVYLMNCTTGQLAQLRQCSKQWQRWNQSTSATLNSQGPSIKFGIAIRVKTSKLQLGQKSSFIWGAQSPYCCWDDICWDEIRYLRDKKDAFLNVP